MVNVTIFSRRLGDGEGEREKDRKEKKGVREGTALPSAVF